MKNKYLYCPNCGPELTDEIHEQPDGKLLCEICGWILDFGKDGEKDDKGKRISGDV